MTQSRWREYSAQVIARVVADNPGLPEPELRKKISAAYPFGQRQHHPYKMWLSAVNRYFGAEKKHIKSKSVAPGACEFCAGAGCMFCGAP